MPWFRIYVDKKITDKGGGEHSRQVDVDSKNEAEARKSLTLKRDEEVNQIVSLAEDPS